MRKILFGVAAFLILLSYVSAQQDDPADLSKVLGGEFNVSPEKIPTSQEDIDKLREDYLKKEWSEVISKNKILGPVHNFFLKDNTQIVFQVLFVHKYEISATFFWIFVLWIFVWIVVYMSLKSINRFSILIGAGAAILLAQSRAINYLVKSVLDLLTKQSNAWARTIIYIIIFGVLAVGYVISKMIDKNLKKNEENKNNAEMKQRVEEAKALAEPIKRG